ncbi:MAG TPA: ribose-phosphate pyrophosphokinase [Bacteroidales bacterium]|nr:ribose-phosphate pyrophosphokinase [Bacteroidales bacterium]
MITMTPKVSIFSGRDSLSLTEKICEIYGKPMGNVDILRFSDGEFQPSFEDNIRGNDVFIIQSTFPPAENILELLMLIDAAKRASAEQIIAVIPYYGYARQDRKDKPRVSIASKLVANLLSAAGVTRLITIDLHADQIQGFFDVPVDHLYASSIFIPDILDKKLGKAIMASPDTGGTRRAAAYAKILGTEMVVCYKQRSKPGEVGAMALLGDVRGKDVILLDDIIDSGGTIKRAANLIMENGAASVRALITHPVLSGKAYQNLDESALTELVVTDTIPLKKEHPKIRVLTTADLLAEVIRRVHKHKSISSLYKFDNLISHH